MLEQHQDKPFTEPPGFMNSAFPRISHPVSSLSLFSRINGVLPMACKSVSRFRPLFMSFRLVHEPTSNKAINCSLRLRDIQTVCGFRGNGSCCCQFSYT